ncbi:MAG: PPC domain-containing protein [Candidatus Solibacter usitatus]|nr:PPC domain-containing protein [Candidatus Solibacter usitatus]
MRAVIALFLFATPPQLLETPQPRLSYLLPSGGQRGRTVQVDAAGANLSASTVLITGSGVTAQVMPPETAAKVRLLVNVAANAELGEREIRLVNAGGVSNRILFVVGQLPEITETEPNSEFAKAQRVESLPIVVNGQIAENDRDYFRFSAKAGQKLVLAAHAKSLTPFIADAVPGWFDACLTLFDESGKQLHYADDFRFHPDPVLFFHVPRDGDYIVEIRDVIHRGRADFIYRLVLEESPRLTGVESEVTGGVPELEPNNSPRDSQRVSVPVTIHGKIDRPGDADYFIFRAAARQQLIMEVNARRLDSPLDSILTLYNPKWDQIAENDDWTDPASPLITHHADSRLAFTAPVDGDYVLRIRDVQGHGGEDYFYRLSIGQPKPDFSLRITPDNPRVAPGDTAAIAVSAQRKDGFDGEIELFAEGLPQGFAVSPAAIPSGQTEGRLTISAPADAALGVLAPSISGRAKIGEELYVRHATTAESVMQAFAYTHYVPTNGLLLAVVPAAAYSLTSRIAPGTELEVAQDSEVPIIVKVSRKNGARGGVSFSAPRPAPGITLKPLFLQPDKDEATLLLNVTGEARAGLRQNLIINAVMKNGAESITRFVPAIPIRVVAARK